jgi:hypothetical protein
MRNRIIGIALGALLGVIMIAWRAERSAAPAWNILPENSGAIRTVAFQYTRDSSRVTWGCIAEFLRQVSHEVEIIAICGTNGDAGDLRSAIARLGINPQHVRVVVVGEPITGWCKDRFLVADGSIKSLLLPIQPAVSSSARLNDSLSARAVSGAFPKRFRVIRTSFHFDAGDILATEDSVIVSEVLFRKNDNLPDLAGEIERLCGRKVLVLHDVPEHHIGMFAAPLDKGVVVVGDPDIAKGIWTDKISRQLGKADFSDRAVKPFLNAAYQLRAAGMHIVRVPTAYIEPQVYITYTNGVFETRGGKRIAYVPCYNVPELDEAAFNAYRNAGWEVKPIHVGSVYKYRGTIGCLINVLERSEY